MQNLLEVQNLSIHFRFGARRCAVVDRVSFHIAPGEILALVGESGCGKSLSCLALTGLTPPAAECSAERMRFFQGGREYDLAHLSKAERRKVRGGGIAYIFQEPSASLNPVFRVGDQIAETIALHRPEIRDRREAVVQLLTDVGIPEPARRASAYPHELSGGMQQRVMIALALAGNPALLIADEPTTALDVTIQAQILELLTTLAVSRQMGILLVTHNLGIVAQVADRVAVMYAGCVVESAPKRQLLEHPVHPYTRALLRAVPRLHARTERLETIPGQVPTPEHFPAGCRFATRCAVAATLPPGDREHCFNRRPPDERFGPGHSACCFFPGVIPEGNDADGK